MTTLGQNIRKYREAAGLTQNQIAGKIGVYNNALSQWELDKSRPSIETLEKLAGALGTTASKLLEGM
jgi:transcriptional regulator with XRE-family HTH domain